MNPPLTKNNRTRLIRARRRKRLSQKKAADRFGISVVHLCRLELGRCGASEETLRVICRKLGLEYIVIFKEAWRKIK